MEGGRSRRVGRMGPLLLTSLVWELVVLPLFAPVRAVPDEREIPVGAPDCNRNGVRDECDLAAGTSTDCNRNAVPDECDILTGAGTDCNRNGIPDACDVLRTDLTFQFAPTYFTGNQPVSVTSGDLDGDQDLDLAVANKASYNVSVLLNQCGGTFAAAVNYAAGNFPRSVTSGDLDGDQDLDLAVANGGSDNVSVLLNQGGGTFAAAVNYTAGGGAFSVKAGDLDGDQDLDLALSNYSSDNVSVLLNQGGGTLTAAVNYAAGDGPISVTAGDLDGDHNLDLAVANSLSHNVSVLLNQGGGTFAAAVNYAAGVGPNWGVGPNSVAAGDLDGDQDLDLAVANSRSNDVAVLLNQGGGTFAAAVNHPAGNTPVSVAAGDLDGDQDLDLAVAKFELGQRPGGSVLVLLNRGGGTFDGVNYAAWDGPSSVTAGDLDGDQDLDLAVANVESENVSVLLNHGGGRFDAAAVNFVAEGRPNSVTAGDLDGDQYLDLAVTSGVVLVYLHTTLPPVSQDRNGNGIPDECERMLRGDCDGDGEVRGVVTDAVFLLNFLFLGGRRPACLAACDANGDGQVIGVVTDAVYLLTYNFLGGPPPVAPSPDCGPGERDGDEALGCATPPAACAPAP